METIVCSAIWYKDLETPKFKPYNTNKGIVFCGLRHIHCLHQMVAMTGKHHSNVGEYEQGFLTSTNRFVGREEAGQIALAAKQITQLRFGLKELYSEDLF